MAADIVIAKLNDSFGYILATDASLVRHIYDSLSFWVPGYKFMPSYKNGWFDGKIHLMSLTNRTFPLGLSEYIYNICKNLKYTVEIEKSIIESFSDKFFDETEVTNFFKTKKFYVKKEEIHPREDQLEATLRAISTKRCVNICPTSFGKSISITMECLWFIAKGYKCLIVVPTKDLVDQFANDIKDYATSENGLEDWYPNVQIIYAGKDKNIQENTDICISTWQSLMNIADEDYMNQFDVVILDECFHEDSKVLTPSGFVKIKDIKPGDKIINYSEEYKDYKIDEVIEVHKNLASSMKEKMYELEFDNKKNIKVTGNHKFLTTSGWKRVDELTEEDEIISCNNDMKLIRRTEIEKPEVVYNLHVKDDHNYIVEGAVVHNCHRGQGTKIQEIMNNATSVKYRTGWTGTLSEETISELQIKGIFGPVKNIISTKELMDKGIVAQLSIVVARIQYPNEMRYDLTLMDYHKQTKTIEEYKKRNVLLLKILSKFNNTGLMLYRHISHGETLFELAREMFPDRNIYLIHGGYFRMNDKKYKNFEDLKAIIENEENGIVIGNYGVVSTGISIKNLHWLMFAAPVKSFITTVQGIGRVLRISKVKHKAILIDIVDDFSTRLTKNKSGELVERKNGKLKENYAIKHFAERFQIYNTQNFDYQIHNMQL